VFILGKWRSLWMNRVHFG